MKLAAEPSDAQYQALGKRCEENLRIISKDMTRIARMLAKTDFPFKDDNSKNQFKTLIGQGNFYLHSYTMATHAFNAMMNDYSKNPKCTKLLPEYFMDEAAKMFADQSDQDIKNQKQKEKKA